VISSFFDAVHRRKIGFMPYNFFKDSSTPNVNIHINFFVPSLFVQLMEHKKLLGRENSVNTVARKWPMHKT
jgi:hypothetical protein